MNKKLEARRLADLHIEAILKFIRETNEKEGREQQGIVIATYTQEEFAELKPGEDYELFKLTERYVAEDLVNLGIDNVNFQEVDSIAYYKFIAEHNLPNDQASISFFANCEFIKKTKKLK